MKNFFSFSKRSLWAGLCALWLLSLASARGQIYNNGRVAINGTGVSAVVIQARFDFSVWNGFYYVNYYSSDWEDAAVTDVGGFWFVERAYGSMQNYGTDYRIKPAGQPLQSQLYLYDVKEYYGIGNSDSTLNFVAAYATGVGPQVATTTAPGTPTASTVAVTGTVNPNAANTPRWQFQYWRDPNLGASASLANPTTAVTPGGAADLDGVDDYLKAPTGSYFLGGDYTVEGWVYVRNHANWARLLDFGNGPGFGTVLLALSEGTTGFPVMAAYGDSGSLLVSIKSAIQLPLNQWVHLASVKSGSTGILYMNGGEVGRGTFSASPSGASRVNCYIGRSEWTGDAYANAFFDDIRIWNVGRTAAQIEAGRFEDRSTDISCVANWRFDEGAASGATALDSALINGAQNATFWNGGSTDTVGRTDNTLNVPGLPPANVSVSATLTGLFPDTSYYYQIHTTSASGSGDSTVRTFVTTIPTPTMTVADVSPNEDAGTFTVPITSISDNDATFNTGFALEVINGDGTKIDLVSPAQGARARYVVVEGDFNWAEAKRDAERRGGHLVTISSAAENTTVQALVGTRTAIIGLNDSATEGQYKWTYNNEAISYANWSTGEPNNYAGDEDFCTMLSDGRWNDLNGTWRVGAYVLEYESLPAGSQIGTTLLGAGTTSFTVQFRTLFNVSGSSEVKFRLYSLLPEGRVGVREVIKTITVNSVNDRPTTGLGAGFDFNPTTSSYLDLPDGSYFSGANPFTVESWVMVRAHRTWARLFDFGKGRSLDNVLGALSGNLPGQPVFSIYNGGALVGQVVSSEALPLNQWAHLSYVYDGTNLKIFINGIEKGTAVATGVSANLVRTSNYIGRSNWAEDQYADAKISEFRIWNVARTGEQLRANSKIALPGNEPNLQVYYRGLEGAGPTARDAALSVSSPVQSGPQDATLVGGTTWFGAGTASVPMGTAAARYAVGEDQATDFLLPGFDFETTLTPTAWTSETAPANGAVVFSASTAGKFTYTPTLNYNGADQFTYRVTDGHSGYTNFTVYLQVSPDNDSPVLGSIPNQNFLEGTTNIVTFSAADPEDGGDLLFYSATSSDQGIVRSAGLTFGGSGANRTLTIRPVAGESGTTTITISARDRGYEAFPERTTSTTFVVAFEPLPAFAILDLGALDSYTESEGVALNDKLEVIATAKGGSSLNSTRGFIYPGPGLLSPNEELEPITGTTMTLPGAINNNSLVAFNSIASAASSAVTFDGDNKTTLTSSSAFTRPAALTDSGLMVGTLTSAGGVRTAFRATSPSGSATSLGLPGGFDGTFGYGIQASNALTFVVGVASNATTKAHQGFAHNGSAFYLLPPLAAGVNSTARGINEKGQIVGSADLGVVDGNTLDLQSGRYVDLPDGVYFNGSFTVEAWVYIRSHASHARLFDFGNGSGNNNVLLSLSSGGTGVPYFHIYNGGAATSIQAPGANALPLTTWTHVAVAYNSTNSTGAIFINGVQVVSGTMQTPPNITRTNPWIGKSNWGADAAGNYLIDNFRIYNTARDAAAMVVSKNAPDMAGTEGLKLQYRFDEGTGSIAADTSGNNVTGALTGGAVFAGPNGLAYGLPTTRAALYTGGVVQNLGTLPGGGASVGLGVNFFGKVVGSAVGSARQSAILYAASTLHNMNDLISDSSWHLAEARAINTQGAVVGTGIKGGSDRGFLALPATIVGKKVVRPEGAVTAFMPEIEILDGMGYGTLPTQFFFWSVGEAKLFATRPCIARIKWFTSATLSINTARIEVVTANIWPRNPTIHVVNAPVDLEPKFLTGAFGYAYQQIHYPDEATTQVTVDATAKRFEAKTNDWSVIRYVRHDGQLPNAITQPAYFEVVRSYVYSDNSVFKDNVPWTVGDTIFNPTHFDYGKNGWVFFEKAPYDGDGPDRAYDRPTRAGPIIPVNKDSVKAGPAIVVGWYHTNQIGVAWPSEAWRYSLSWPDPSTTNKIIIASLKGSGRLDPAIFQSPRIYVQDDSSKPGYNPNEEHALIAPADSGNGLFALRSDLNKIENISEPFALVKYKNDDDEWAIKVFKVVAEEAPYTFNYTGTAGLEVQPPYPLSILTLCEATRFTSGPGWEDYHGKIYAKAAGQYGESATLVVQYYYPMQPTFYSPASLNYTVGQCVPWLDRLATDSLGGTPVDVKYNIVWPSTAPILSVGRTAFHAGDRLPDFVNMADSKIVFDDQARDSGDELNTLARFYDPITPRSYNLLASESMPGADVVKRQTVNGKEVFVDLPWPLRVRMTYDPINRVLSFGGYYQGDFDVGDPLLLPNIITTQEKLRLNALSTDSKWTNLVHKIYDLTRNPNQLDTDWNGVVDDKVLIGLSVKTNEVTVTADQKTLIESGYGIYKKAQVASFGEAIKVVHYLPGEGDTVSWEYKAKVRQIQAEQFSGVMKAVTAGVNAPSAQTRPLKALKFDGVDDYVNAGTDVELNSRSFTVEFWANRYTATGTDYAVGQGVGELNEGLHIGFRSGTAFTFAFWGGDLNATVAVTNVNQWHHYACVFDSDNKSRKIYMDGKVISSDIYNSDYLGSGPITIGLALDQNSTAFNGELDELRIWTTARSQAQVKHDMSRRLLGTEVDLVLYYRFDEASGSTTVNAAAANLPGLPANGTLNGPTRIDSAAPTGIPPRYITVAENDNSALGALPVGLHIIRIDDGPYAGDLKRLLPDNVFDERLTLRQSPDFGGDPDSLTFEWYYHPALSGAAPELPDVDELGVITNARGWLKFNTDPANGAGINQITIGEGGESGLLTISDNWFISRYKGYRINNATDWSDWIGDPASANPRKPVLAEGWIKRVVAGLNPFDQRIGDFRNSEVSTLVSMLSQAGGRYEGDIAFNPSAEAINSVGLIEAYETVVNRGRKLSMDGLPAVNYGPANNAILLASTKIADLYTLLGNEAYSDAQDPTIGFGTAGVAGNNASYGSLASSIFAFQNQLDSLLEEELVLLRGRDDRAAGTQATPIYNRLFWNFTLGEGEVAYQQNYNVLDQNSNGFIEAADARKMYPQGHGDAWGHYLKALKQHYDLLRHDNFTWIPTTEAVTVQGAAIEVDFQDERKFARTAGFKAKAGAEIVDLTYRNRYVEDPNGQWQGYKDADNDRGWGVTEWARRAAQGSYFDWITANSILPATDTNPSHSGIQKVDRTTVPELREIVVAHNEIQSKLDMADIGLNPLGLARGVVPFDIDPAQVSAGKTHFEQVSDRAIKAMNNAIATWNEANKANELLRQNQDTLQQFNSNVEEQERDLKNRLIEIFGYPYAGDIGPNKLYPSSYDGADFYHYMYVGATELDGVETAPTTNFNAFFYKANYGLKTNGNTASGVFGGAAEAFYFPGDSSAADMTNRAAQTMLVVPMPYTTKGWGFRAPASYGLRRAPGEIQIALSEMLQNEARIRQASIEYQNITDSIEAKLDLLQGRYDLRATELKNQNDFSNVKISMGVLKTTATIAHQALSAAMRTVHDTSTIVLEATPKVSGPLAFDLMAPLRGTIKAGQTAASSATFIGDVVAQVGIEAAAVGLDVAQGLTTMNIKKAEFDYEIRQQVRELEDIMRLEATKRVECFRLVEAFNQSMGRFHQSIAKGQRLLEERLAYRQKVAGNISNRRYQDMTFRIFRNDALQKYRSQFDLAQRYVFLAATAYDYEVNLLGSDSRAGQSFLTDIIRQRALGQMRDGMPIAGPTGLADPLARLTENFGVLKTQLGFNNPQTETGRFSLRNELFRLRSSSEADWRAELLQAHTTNLWNVPEFRRFCRPFAPESAGPQPGLVFRFSTAIRFGENFFGKELSGGDSAYDPSRFATKIHSVGVWFKDYNGNGMSVTPRIYLVPVGVDILRSPTGNDLSTRQWRVLDQALPVPFTVGSSQLKSADYIPSVGSLGGSFGEIRRFASFRGFHDSGSFSEAETISDSRLIGRSVWNTEWLLIIPGGTLLNNQEAGLEAFINSVSDIKLFFKTYSYAGN